MTFSDLLLWWITYFLVVGLIPIILLLYLLFPAKARLKQTDEIINRVTRPRLTSPDPEVEQLIWRFIDNTKEKIKERYDYRNYYFPLGFITFVLAIAFFLILSSGYPVFHFDTLDKLLLKIPATVFYGFIGGWFFALFAIIGRYESGDITSSLILHLTCQLLLSGGVAFFASTLTAEFLDPGIAFAAGFVPYQDITDWLRLKFRQKFGIQQQEATDNRLPNRARVDSLTAVDGISTEHRERLREEDIRTIQNLAYTNPLYLYLITPYQMQRIIDWIDQAYLLLYVPVATVERLSAMGIRGVIELSQVVSPSGRTLDVYPNERTDTNEMPPAGEEPTQNGEQAADQGNDEETSGARMRALTTVLGVEQAGAEYLVYQLRNDPQVRLLISMWREFGGT